MTDKERLANGMHFLEKLLQHVNRHNRELEKVDHLPGRKTRTVIHHLPAHEVHKLMRDLRLVLKGKKARHLGGII